MLNFLCTKYGKSSLTVAEAAVELGIGIDDVQACISNGSLQTLNVGSGILIPIVSIINLLGAKPTNLSTSLETTEEGRYTTTTPDWEINVVEEGTDMANGSVTYVKGSNRWIVQLDLGKTPEGKRIRKSKSFKTEDEARDALAVELAKLHPSGIPEANRIPTYEDIAKEYFSMKRTTSSDRTWDTYKEFSKYSLKDTMSLDITKQNSARCESEKIYLDSICLGQKPITEITKSDFVALFNQLKKIYVSSTLKKTKTSAGLIFDYAIEKGLISVNPAKSMGKLPKSEIISDDAIDPEKALDSDEVQYIRECAECSETMDGMLLLLLYTGMRPGELRALYKTDIDVERGVVRIWKAATIRKLYDKEGNKIGRQEYISHTKTQYGSRELSVPREILELALAQHERMISDRFYIGSPDTKYLFPDRNGDFFKERAFYSRWRKFRDKYNLDADKYYPYVFRHTMCTNLLRQGVNPKVVQKILGDNTLDIILSVYNHMGSAGDVENAMCSVHDLYSDLVVNSLST